MKRSEINKILKESISFVERMNFHLPPFAHWSLDDWKSKGEEYDEIRDNMLGWDITDFGRGDFYREGLVLFTIRNGNLNIKKYKKPYAEKILIVREEQITPFHFHWNKMEDIINRGGGTVLIQLYNSTGDGNLADTPVLISMDGRNYTAPAGTTVRLTPGESITLFPGVYHKFWGEKGKGLVLLGEVSSVNDDNIDNRFLEKTGRFPEIEEDEPPFRLLVIDYRKGV
ncbi:MAG TPA: D-lyxose/D-mannose family sugar isomerase [bacterium]|nr:D-lyxose/D-mannose family sugar isomerase [bacterium]HPO82423.1 D-lyxose/D-mannose family sugar isomerase [bacterium]